MVAGALFSYVSMAVGWVLLGIACLRARVIPLPLALCLIPDGLLAFFAIPPCSVVFGAVVLGLGVWPTRHRHVPLRDRFPQLAGAAGVEARLTCRAGVPVGVRLASYWLPAPLRDA